jgi:hypothetical protein
LWDDAHHVAAHNPDIATATARGDRNVNILVPLGGAVIILVVLGVAVVFGLNYRHLRRRTNALHRLLDDADHLESDLKECRQRLDRAHAVMAVAPGVPAAGESDARLAVDAGLRSLLEHRLWIRDRAPDASQRELDAAVSALAQARARLEPQLQALDHAQRELDQAVREHIEREAGP